MNKISHLTSFFQVVIHSGPVHDWRHSSTVLVHLVVIYHTTGMDRYFSVSVNKRHFVSFKMTLNVRDTSPLNTPLRMVLLMGGGGVKLENFVFSTELIK